MMNNNIKRWGINLAIALLFINAMVLTVLCWFGGNNGGLKALNELTDDIFKRGGDGGGTYAEYVEYAYNLDMLAPLRAAVRTPEGLCALETREQSRRLFEDAQETLTSTFDTAVLIGELGEDEWRDYLSQNMLFFDFEGGMPLYVLAAYFGTGQFDKLLLEPRYMALSIKDENLWLCVKTADGKAYAFETAAHLNINSFVAQYPPNGAAFGYESGYNKPLDGESLLINEREAKQNLSSSAVIRDYASAGAERMINNILGAFGLNTYSTGGYIESDSTHVYVESLNTLRIREDGSLSYAAGMDEPAGSEPTPEEKVAMVSDAANTAENTLGSFLDNASLYIEKTYYKGGDFVVLFGCEHEGLRIFCDEGYIARFVYRNGKLVSAQLKLITFSLTGEYEDAVPDLQAAAIAAKNGAGKLFELRYGYVNGQWRTGWYYAA